MAATDDSAGTTAAAQDSSVAGKTIVITGAANGLGRAWAEAFVAEGAQVVGVDIDLEGLARLAEKNVLTLGVDVTDSAAVASVIDYAVAETGRLDVLFNNAGLGYGHTVEASPPDAFEQHVAVHLFACIYGMRAAIPVMRQQGYGRIINTVSRNAEFAQPGTSAYAAAKAGMWSASRVAAAEVSDADILINMLIPGPTNTRIWGRDMPKMQSPAVTVPTARLLATLPSGGPTGKVFWNEQEYELFAAVNQTR